ncbi:MULTISPECIES: siroheme decarboxylase subunit alpha [Methanoculleus]|uniref:siroheme decarboxylase n=2 Tax=Methanoculleus TaxID=45989 RepID=A3CTW1_METMJ|nr:MULTISPECIES: siroheme decarboxylase subunit alpha [Methanoculleus]ABN56811.1 transcriptional regulator, AsnC family [Methanoculleus marisnigri JR1]MCC7556239.1 Lrp/AsnC family transcriptional regulator [Methanoculleus marisnigri]UYU18239.1 Lrp/AsnC family transcriptional regulator [Methanoculleus submarinus]
MRLDPLDRVLLQRVQDDFPLDPRPYRVIGEALGMPELEVMARLAGLSRRGVIRHIAPILEPGSLGIRSSTLVAMRVPEKQMHEVAAIVNGYDGVSHNYRRDGDYNLWFTVAAAGEEELHGILEEIVRRSTIPPGDVLNLPMVRRFKLDVRFRFLAEEDDDGQGR